MYDYSEESKMRIRFMLEGSDNPKEDGVLLIDVYSNLGESDYDLMRLGEKWFGMGSFQMLRSHTTITGKYLSENGTTRYIIPVLVGV